MATVNYIACDRCGKKLVKEFWSANKPYKMRMLFRQVSLLGYANKEYNYDFCYECGVEVRDFLKGKKEKQEENNE